MKFKFSYTLLEKFIFFGVLLFSIYPNLINTYNPTLDGPAHLYNSKLLTYYFSNPTIDHYYHLNKTPSPNLFSHFFLFVFNTVFESHTSEKLFFLFYFISFPLGLRYFIKAYNPQSVFLSIIGIPLSHACLLYFGFYNFSISFTFIFIAIGFYYIHIYKKTDVCITRYTILFFLITLTYFSAVLSYVYLLSVLGLYEINTIYQLYKNGFRKHIKTRILKNIIIVLPSLVCFIIFYYNVKFPEDNTSLPANVLLTNLLDFKSLIVYGYAVDVPYTKTLFILLLILVGYVLVRNVYKAKNTIKKNADTFIYLILTLLTIIAYFIIPDGSSAKMMSDRLSYLFSIFLVLWIVSQQHIHYPKIIGILFIIPHYFLLQLHSETQKEYNSTALAIVESAKHIKENSVVLPVNLMTDWIFIMYHFPNYLGVNKPLIILENYEAAMPWFPLNWNPEKMPTITLNGKETIENLNWPVSKNQTLKKEIDYVYLFGSIADIRTQANWKDLCENLDSAYVLTYQNKKNNIYLFKHK